MPDQLKELISCHPLILFGGVVGQADLFFQSIPVIVKAIIITFAAGMAYADVKYSIKGNHAELKSDISMIRFEQLYAKGERERLFRHVEDSGDCKSGICDELSGRIDALEGFH